MTQATMAGVPRGRGKRTRKQRQFRRRVFNAVVLSLGKHFKINPPEECATFRGLPLTGYVASYDLSGKLKLSPDPAESLQRLRGVDVSFVNP